MRYEYVNVIDFVAPYMSESPTQEQLESFGKHLSLMHSSASMRDSEESQKQEFSAFLEKIFSYTLRSRGKIDLAILMEYKIIACVEDAKESILEYKASRPESKIDSLAYNLQIDLIESR